MKSMLVLSVVGTANFSKEARLERNMKITASHLICWAGLAAILVGNLFIVIHLMHPPENLSSVVTTGAWPIIHYLIITMSLFGVIAIARIYGRQVKEAGPLGYDTHSGPNSERKPRNLYPSLSGIFAHVALRKFGQGAEL